MVRTIMNNDEGGTCNFRFNIPKFAEITAVNCCSPKGVPAKGTRSLNTSNAPMRKGSNTGTRRYTDSKENEEIEAIFPVPKNPVCNNTKKNSAIRASERVNFRNEGFVVTACPFIPFVKMACVSIDFATFVSSSLQRTRVVKNVT